MEIKPPRFSLGNSNAIIVYGHREIESIQSRPTIDSRVNVLRFKAKNLPDLPVDFSHFDWATADRHVAKTEVFVGSQKVPLGDLFAITSSGKPHERQWHFEGQLNRFNYLGAGLTDGALHIHGNVGTHLGSRLRGGTIHVHGNTDLFAGAEMRGGLLQIDGDTGDFLGAAYVGSKLGMRGGKIIVRGNAGNEVGCRMRRGWITIGGDCGNLAAYRMLAGSLFVFGNCGQHPGADMRRGTIVLCGTQEPRLLPTFRAAGSTQLTILEMMLRDLERSGMAIPTASKFELYHGDLLAGGRGELLIPAPD